jgi:hypothetical protein
LPYSDASSSFTAKISQIQKVQRTALKFNDLNVIKEKGKKEKKREKSSDNSSSSDWLCEESVAAN